MDVTLRHTTRKAAVPMYTWLLGFEALGGIMYALSMSIWDYAPVYAVLWPMIIAGVGFCATAGLALVVANFPSTATSPLWGITDLRTALCAIGAVGAGLSAIFGVMIFMYASPLIFGPSTVPKLLTMMLVILGFMAPIAATAVAAYAAWQAERSAGERSFRQPPARWMFFFLPLPMLLTMANNILLATGIIFVVQLILYVVLVHNIEPVAEDAPAGEAPAPEPTPQTEVTDVPTPTAETAVEAPAPAAARAESNVVTLETTKVA